MLQEIGYTKNNTRYKATGSFVLKSKDDKHTAMAKTAVAIGPCRQSHFIRRDGAYRFVHSDSKEIYKPVLKELTDRRFVSLKKRQRMREKATTRLGI